MQQDLMRPAIMLGHAEHRELVVVAMTARGHAAEDSDYLNYELDRAALVPDASLPDDVVKVGSYVTYQRDEGVPCLVKLVYPSESDPADSRISVTSPLGATLLGLRPGQSITRMGWDGDFACFTVLAVIPPAPPEG
jgi:regulator of nucleoside diphosphate kinase